MEKHCVYAHYIIKDVIERFQINKDRVAVVLNENNKVVGAISQGDIIRFLCKGGSVYAKVDKVYNSSFLYMKENNMKKAYDFFKKQKITMVPVVDNDFALVNVITLDDIYDYLEGNVQ